MEDKLQLSDSDYFALEAHEWKKKELEYERSIVLLQKEITKRDISILTFNIENLKRKGKEQEEKATELSVKIENVMVAKRKVTEEISERLGLESTNWGYNPETLEIIE